MDSQSVARGLSPRLDASRLMVSDVGEVEHEAGSLDLIFSEDVFEHIPGDAGAVTERIAGGAPGGMALIRPNVFTGITGGHVVEWNPAAFERRVRADGVSPGITSAGAGDGPTPT